MNIATRRPAVRRKCVRHVTTLVALIGMSALAGCTGVAFGQGGPLISGHSPADAGMGANCEPQPINSMPPGAEGIGGGPNARAPNDLNFTLGRGYGE